jgi:uncharacterized cupredoxin-like copper-binding protein
MLSRHDSYVSTALFGIGLYLVAIVLIAVAILIALPSDIYYAFLFGLPAIAVAFVLLAVRRWGLLVSLVGAVIGLLLLTEGADIYLTTPESFFDFTITLFGLVGILIALGASLAGTVQHFRQSVNAGASVPVAVKGIGMALVLLAALSLILTVSQTGDVSATEAEGAIVITADEAKYDVKLVEARPGEDVRILVRNTDPIMHTFTIHDLDIDYRIGPWSEKLIILEGLDARIYGFICRIPGHELDMTGAIQVR